MKRNWFIYITLIFLIFVFFVAGLGYPPIFVLVGVFGVLLYVYHHFTLTDREKKEVGRRKDEKIYHERERRTSYDKGYQQKMGELKAERDYEREVRRDEEGRRYPIGKPMVGKMFDNKQSPSYFSKKRKKI